MFLVGSGHRSENPSANPSWGMKEKGRFKNGDSRTVRGSFYSDCQLCVSWIQLIWPYPLPPSGSILDQEAICRLWAVMKHVQQDGVYCACEKTKVERNTAFLFGGNACGQFPEAYQTLQSLTSILDLEARGGGESSLSALQLTVSLIMDTSASLLICISPSYYSKL